MKKGVVFLLCLAAFALILTARTVRSEEANVLEFKTMVAVKAPFTGTTNPIRGVSGGGAPWNIASGRGELKSDGKIEVEVRGLVLVSTGANPLANFRALVSCMSVDGTGNPSSVNLSTGDFSASAAGDADIEDRVELPSPCIAPFIFVTTSTGRWLAATGQ